MNILYTLNDNFIPQVSAGICSVCENNKDVKKIDFYLMSLKISKNNKEKLKKFIKKKYNRDIYYIELENLDKYFDFSFDTNGWNPIVLARLLLDKLLPEKISKILYLDGDTIVRGSLKELWNLDMKGSVIGASIEPTIDKNRKNSLGLSGLPYYNAGVLLVDLKRWRNEMTGKRIIDFYKKNNGRLFANDQDAINGALKGEILTISPKYNFYNIFYQYNYRFLNKLCDFSYINKDVFIDAYYNPVIIHYLGEERPWRIGNKHKYREDYIKYLNLTPWKGKNFENGWGTYFVLWNLFNLFTKPFPMLRYNIINKLIPVFMKYRSKKIKNTNRKKCL